MKRYEQRQQPAKVYDVHVETKCDLCGKTTTNDWKTSAFDAIETEISMRTGDRYPEGGFGEFTEIDICPDCFTGKLIPWVQSQGGEPTVKEWDC